MGNAYYIAQAFAVVAIVFYLLTFQFKDRSHILWCMTGSALFNACHHFALEGYAATFLALVSMSRSIAAYYITSRWVMSAFVLIAIMLFVWTYQSPIQWLLLIASLLATWASFQTRDRVIRLIFMLTTALWLIHNCWIGTVGGIMLEVCFLGSNIYAYRRFYKTTLDA